MATTGVTWVWGLEALDEKTAPDLKEAYNLIWTDDLTRPVNVWPTIPGWRGRAQRYFPRGIGRGPATALRFALDLGLAEDFFDDKVNAPMAALRFLHYPGTNAIPKSGPAPRAQAGAGTHTDYGNVTLLATDGVAGLQVRRRDGKMDRRADDSGCLHLQYRRLPDALG